MPEEVTQLHVLLTPVSATSSLSRVESCTFSLGNITPLLREHVRKIKYTLNSEPKALTGDKSEDIKSRGTAEAFIRGFSPVKAEGEEFNVLILSYTRELSRPFKENKG